MRNTCIGTLISHYSFGTCTGGENRLPGTPAIVPQTLVFGTEKRSSEVLRSA